MLWSILKQLCSIGLSHVWDCFSKTLQAGSSQLPSVPVMLSIFFIKSTKHINVRKSHFYKDVFKLLAFLQFHKKLFGDDHQVISIDVYAGKPDFFAMHHCTTHTSKPISMSCQKCDQLFCVNCALDTCKTGRMNICTTCPTWAWNVNISVNKKTR